MKNALNSENTFRKDKNVKESTKSQRSMLLNRFLIQIKQLSTYPRQRRCMKKWKRVGQQQTWRAGNQFLKRIKFCFQMQKRESSQISQGSMWWKKERAKKISKNHQYLSKWKQRQIRMLLLGHYSTWMRSRCQSTSGSRRQETNNVKNGGRIVNCYD